MVIWEDRRITRKDRGIAGNNRGHWCLTQQLMGCAVILIFRSFVDIRFMALHAVGVTLFRLRVTCIDLRGRGKSWSSGEGEQRMGQQCDSRGWNHSLDGGWGLVRDGGSSLVSNGRGQ